MAIKLVFFSLLCAPFFQVKGMLCRQIASLISHWENYLRALIISIHLAEFQSYSKAAVNSCLALFAEEKEKESNLKFKLHLNIAHTLCAAIWFFAQLLTIFLKVF